MQINQGYVTTSINGAVAAVEFFNPQGNSLPGKLLHELARAIAIAGEDKKVRVIALRSAGQKAFCAGASFAELAAVSTEEEGAAFFGGFARVINAMRLAPKFVVARVQGRCVGGGVGLAAAADYAIALDKAEIKLSELAIGIGPFVIGPAVERKIGLAAFSQLTLNPGEWFTAAWAEAKGLFAEVHGSIEGLDGAVEKLGQTLASYSPEAMAQIKAMLWHGTAYWDELLRYRATISSKLAQGSFTKEALEKFMK